MNILTKINYWKGFLRLWIVLSIFLLIPTFFFIFLYFSNLSGPCSELANFKSVYGSGETVKITKFTMMRNERSAYENKSDDEIVEMIIKQYEDEGKELKLTKSELKENLSEKIDYDYKDTDMYKDCQSDKDWQLIVIIFLLVILTIFWFILFLVKWIFRGFKTS